MCCGDGATKTYTLLVEMQNSGATRKVLQKHPRHRPSSSGSAQEKGKSCVDARSSTVRERPEGERMRRVDEWSVHSWFGDTPGRWEGKSTDACGTLQGLENNLLNEKRPQRLTEQCHVYKSLGMQTIVQKAD